MSVLHTAVLQGTQTVPACAEGMFLQIKPPAGAWSSTDTYTVSHFKQEDGTQIFVVKPNKTRTQESQEPNQPTNKQPKNS